MPSVDRLVGVETVSLARTTAIITEMKAQGLDVPVPVSAPQPPGSVESDAPGQVDGLARNGATGVPAVAAGGIGEVAHADEGVCGPFIERKIRALTMDGKRELGKG